jgi:hypothetical protein
MATSALFTDASHIVRVRQAELQAEIWHTHTYIHTSELKSVPTNLSYLLTHGEIFQSLLTGQHFKTI